MRIDDSELIARWVQIRCETSFNELVARHSAVVYGAALRSTQGNCDLAQEITQRVFIDFAAKAPSLLHHSPNHIVGWLYTATRFTASKSFRSESLRRERESQAARMSAPLSESLEPNWDELRPVLDSAMDELTPADRDAVLLRYFESRPLAAIGVHLQISEDAARMRVARALDKLRSALAHRGITTTAAALALHLGAHAATPLPASIAASLTAAALGVSAGLSAAALTTAATLSTPTSAVIPVAPQAVSLAVMSKSIAKLALGATLAATAVTPIVVLQRSNQHLRTELAAQRAAVAQTAISPTDTPPPQPNVPPGLSASDPEKLEILRLRGEVARLGAQLMAATNKAPNFPTAAAPSPPATSAPWIPGSQISASEWRDVGFASPESTIQTAFWALRTANLDRLIESLELPPGAGELLRKGGAQVLPTTGAGRAESILLLEKREISPTEAEIDFQLQGDAGFPTRETMKLRQKNGAWQAQLPEAFNSPKPRPQPQVPE